MNRFSLIKFCLLQYSHATWSLHEKQMASYSPISVVGRTLLGSRPLWKLEGLGWRRRRGADLLQSQAGGRPHHRLDPCDAISLFHYREHRKCRWLQVDRHHARWKEPA